MNKKIIAIVIIGMFMLTSFSVVSAINIEAGEKQPTTSILSKAGNTIYVDDNYDSSTPGWQVDHFDNIKDGINAANNGDTIFVYDGTYSEYPIVDKSIILNGANKDTTFVKGAVKITADEVTMSGFTVGDINSETNENLLGIEIEGSYNTVEDNAIKEISSSMGGIVFGIFSGESGSHNNLINNFITGLFSEFQAYGIFLEGNSDYNIISGNTVTNINNEIEWSMSMVSAGILAGAKGNIIKENVISNLWGMQYSFGILASGPWGPSDGNIITGNTIENIETCPAMGRAIGIAFDGSFNTVTENTVTNLCGYMTPGLPAIVVGISGDGSYGSAHNNTIESNTVTNIASESMCDGICLNRDANSIIKGNTVTGIKYIGFESVGAGISLRDCSNATIEQNNISGISGYNIYGIYLEESTYSLITHNNIYILGEKKPATFIFKHYISDGKFDETKISSNIWYQNYWGIPRDDPKLIYGTLILLHDDGSKADEILKYNQDPDPLDQPYGKSKSSQISRSCQSSNFQQSHQHLLLTTILQLRLNLPQLLKLVKAQLDNH